MGQQRPDLLRSYVSGGWHTAPDEGVSLHDAATGEPVAKYDVLTLVAKEWTA